MKSARLALIGAAVAALTGCSLAPRDTRAAYEAVEPAAPQADGRGAMAELPPAAGAVAAVLQSEAHTVLTQRIVLKGDPDTIGENAIIVKVDQSKGPADLGGPVGMPTKAMIASELDESFAGVDMHLSETFDRNTFGPFGYAIGHPSARVTCIYAWQWGIWKPGRIGEAPMGAPSMPTQPTSVRVRLCRSAIGETEILPMLRAMQVFPPGSQVAYVDPNYKGGEAGGDALAAAGVGYFVVPGATPAPRPERERLDPAPKPHRRKVAHLWTHHERTADIEERAAADDPPAGAGVAVPMPAGGAAHAAPAATPVNPLLAPLTAAATRPADDMPLPGRVTPAARPTPAARTASIPLPN